MHFGVHSVNWEVYRYVCVCSDYRLHYNEYMPNTEIMKFQDWYGGWGAGGHITSRMLPGWVSGDPVAVLVRHYEDQMNHQVQIDRELWLPV